MINVIAALSLDEVIGRRGSHKLLWDSPVDMMFFKTHTMGQTIVMGNNTFKSMGRALPGRINIVLSRKEEPGARNGVTYYNNYIDIIKEHEDFWVIGGSKLYELFVPIADVVILTQINLEFKGDYVYFPVHLMDDTDDFHLVTESKPVKDINELTNKPIQLIFTRWARSITKRVH